MHLASLSAQPPVDRPFRNGLRVAEDHRGTRAHAQLAVDGLQVRTHGEFADVQTIGHLLREVAHADQLHDLQFPVGQQVAHVGFAWPGIVPLRSGWQRLAPYQRVPLSAEIEVHDLARRVRQPRPCAVAFGAVPGHHSGHAQQATLLSVDQQGPHVIEPCQALERGPSGGVHLGRSVMHPLPRRRRPLRLAVLQSAGPSMRDQSP